MAKKRLLRIIIIFLSAMIPVIALGYDIRNNKEQTASTGNDSVLYASYNIGGTSQTEYAFSNGDGINYFFLPSGFEGRWIEMFYPDAKGKAVSEKIDCSGIGIINNATDENYNTFSLGKENALYEICLIKSANIPAVYLETESGSKEYLLETSDNEETGKILVVNSEGKSEYSGDLERISGRGNSTWKQTDKKSWAIKLSEKSSLCKLRKGKRYNLLALASEGNKLKTKVCMDLAEELGLNYSPQGTWIDLYMNGEYEGLYFITETVSVNSGRVEIDNLDDENEENGFDEESAVPINEGNIKYYEYSSNQRVDGGYLIEKDTPARYDRAEVGFKLNSGATFTASSPKTASRNQIEYIRTLFQNAEDAIRNPESEEYTELIDTDSFAGRFLVDEMSLNIDANITSSYYYKEKGSDVIYAGPIWDYDKSWGESNTDSLEGHYVDYNVSILDGFRADSLDWYNYLMDKDSFRQEVADKYEAIIPFMRDMVENRIDEYADTIKASACMDELRWPRDTVNLAWPGNFTEYDNDVRYTKWFICNRLIALNNRYLEEPEEINDWALGYIQTGICNGQVHEVKLILGDEELQTLYIEDGESISDLPELDNEIYCGWYYKYSLEQNRTVLPVFEDCTLFARRRDTKYIKDISF